MEPKRSSKNDRHCPALNEAISSQRCGSERGSKIACPGNCIHSPYAIANYDKGMALTQGLVGKILDFIKTEVDRDEMAQLTSLAQLDGKGRPSKPDEFFQHLIHFGLAFFRNAEGQTLADRWRQKSFAGLTNDEQVAATAYGRSFVTVLEVQDIAPDGQMWVTDLFHPEAGRLLLMDRSLAPTISRFTLLFSWFLPLPHYTRVSGVTAVQVSRDTLERWRADLERSHKLAQRGRPDLTREEYLASTLYLQIQRMTEIGKEWQASILREMDFCRAIARFNFKAPFDEIVGLLSGKPEIEAIEPVAGDGFDKPVRQFSWVRRAETKALEAEMPTAFQHVDSSDSVGGLATLRVYSDRLVLEAFSRQKYEFARKLLEQWLGSNLVFEAESMEDVAAMMAEKGVAEEMAPPRSPEVSPAAVFASGSKSSESRRVPDSSPIPAELTKEALKSFYEDRYRKFPDEPVPMLKNATPREASRQISLRPQLIELMKMHIHHLEEINRKDGLQLSLDWLLEELRIPELRGRC